MAEDDKPKEDVQSFVFERELAEVYLLLDFLSGRADKNLSTAFNGAGLPPVMSIGGAVGAAAGGQAGASTSLAAAHAWIGAICQIKWPPPEQGGKQPTAAQATTLLLAKDHLNNAAQPANGLAIAFSLMVAGDDDGARRKARKDLAGHLGQDALQPADAARPAACLQPARLGRRDRRLHRPVHHPRRGQRPGRRGAVQRSGHPVGLGAVLHSRASASRASSRPWTA